MSKNSVCVSLASLTLLALTACASVMPPPPAPPTAYPRMAAILTDGVEITGEGWKLTKGDPVAPPFQNSVPSMQMTNAAMLEGYEAAVTAGAKYCRVKVAGREEALYGVLALNPVVSTSTDSSAKRVYRIVVTKKRVDSALGGQVSLLYQPYDYTMQILSVNKAGESYYETVKRSGPSWLLWISDAPFPGQKTRTIPMSS